MNKLLIAGGTALAIAAGIYLTQGTSRAQETSAVPAEGDPIVQVTLPATLSDEAQIGKRAFDAVCAACHGQNATGKIGFGPPLVHMIYEPNHHGDMSFFLAVEQGVRAHIGPLGTCPRSQV